MDSYYYEVKAEDERRILRGSSGGGGRGGGSSGGRGGSSRSGGGGYRSSSFGPGPSSESAYYTASNGKVYSTGNDLAYTAKGGVYLYSKHKNPLGEYNEYLKDGRTYKPLYFYYRAPNYYNEAGYYSNTFLMTYYDGYGYNFYYGTYGYYDYSVNPPEIGVGTGIAIAFVVCGHIFMFGCLAYVFCSIECDSRNYPARRQPAQEGQPEEY